MRQTLLALLLVFSVPPCLRGECGIERQDIKTLADHPQLKPAIATTVEELRALKPPAQARTPGAG